MILENYEPKQVLKHFEAISQIPRGSGNEKAVSDYIAKFAANLGLKYVQDTLNNLIIFKPATKGYENSPAVILQAHLDMVCEKNAGTDHDFLKDPLKLYVDGDKLKAHGTTLGADNGIGVALCMAALESNDFEHPALEIVLTVDEEAGMSGAQNLDASILKATKMINLDSGDDTEFTMGCAAASMAELILPVQWEDNNKIAFKISVTGLKGGHSGIDITDDRGNAMRILAHVLDAVKNECGGIRIAKMSGGMKVNAIPREADAVVVFDNANALEAVRDVLARLNDDFMKTYHTKDLQISLSEAHADKVMRAECGDKLVASLLLMPLGVISMSREIEGLPNASCNIGVLETRDADVIISVMPRGSAGYFLRQTEAQIESLAKIAGATVEFTQRSPAWPYNPTSELLKTALPCYEAIFNRKAIITATAGGLECGILADKIPGLDIIAFGPTSWDVHTPDEWLSIASTGKVWTFLKDVLRCIK